MWVLKGIYYLAKIAVLPAERVWAILFKLQPPRGRRIMITGAVGGSGKTTLAEKYERAHIKLDECKFGGNWVRNSPEAFRANVSLCQTMANGRYVIEGTYHDEKMPAQGEINDRLMEEVDHVIWNDIPKWVALWRKAFRSFKRAIGVASQGAAVERWHNVKAMLVKNYHGFEDRHRILSDAWARHSLRDKGRLCRARWPYFYDF